MREAQKHDHELKGEENAADVIKSWFCIFKIETVFNF